MSILETIRSYKNNRVIREFVEGEAFEKAASDIRGAQGSATTAKAVRAMYANKNAAVVKRVNDYLAAGYMGVYMAALEN